MSNNKKHWKSLNRRGSHQQWTHKNRICFNKTMLGNPWTTTFPCIILITCQQNWTKLVIYNLNSVYFCRDKKKERRQNLEWRLAWKLNATNGRVLCACENRQRQFVKIYCEALIESLDLRELDCVMDAIWMTIVISAWRKLDLSVFQW